MADRSFPTHLKVVIAESIVASSAATLSVTALDVPEMLASAATLGTMAAFIAHSLQKRIQRGTVLAAQ